MNLVKHSGKCMLGELQLESMSVRKRAGMISYIPQRTGISVSMTVRDVCLLGFNPQLHMLESYNSNMRHRADKAIDSVGLAGLYDTDFLTLSEGQKQLCILARTLIEDSALLLLDEPTTGLDPVATEELYELLKRLNREKKTTILMVSHDLNKAVSDAGLILHVNKRSGCGYFGPADKYLDSEAARHFLGLDYKNSEETDSTAKVPIDRNENKAKDMDKNTGKSLLDKVKKGERYV